MKIEPGVRGLVAAPLKRAAGWVTRLIPIPQPELLVGPDSSLRLARLVATFGHRKLLIVSGKVIGKLGLMKPLQDELGKLGTQFVVFDDVGMDAPLAQIEQGVALMREQRCDALLAFGGGSVIDAAKAIALAAANHKPARELAGYFRGIHAPAPIYAVPTTAGTGSEVSVAAVIFDPQAQRKLLIADTRIVPRLAALDPCLMAHLPPDVTAATGMDALTHAVEAYLGHWSTAFSDRMARSAVALIYANLSVVVRDGSDLAARENMALAATHAGFAFTRANVGNVHAIAHQLGARYHTPHGLANAILLPHVLRFELPAATPKLADLGLSAGLGRAAEPQHELARKFIESVDALNRTLGIPKQVDALRERDIAALAQAACLEADLNYPVPRTMSPSDCEALLRAVLPHRRSARVAAGAAADTAVLSVPRAGPAQPATGLQAPRGGSSKVAEPHLLESKPKAPKRAARPAAARKVSPRKATPGASRLR